MHHKYADVMHIDDVVAHLARSYPKIADESRSAIKGE
jgi:hypothetical protein